jgi:hypothetical protein
MEPVEDPYVCTEAILIGFLADCLMAATFWHTVEHDDRVTTSGRTSGFAGLNWFTDWQGRMWTTNIRSIFAHFLLQTLAANDDSDWGADCALLTADDTTNALRIKFVDACRSDHQEFNTLNH